MPALQLSFSRLNKLSSFRRTFSPYSYLNQEIMKITVLGSINEGDYSH